MSVVIVAVIGRKESGNGQSVCSYISLIDACELWKVLFLIIFSSLFCIQRCLLHMWVPSCLCVFWPWRNNLIMWVMFQKNFMFTAYLRFNQKQLRLWQWHKQHKKMKNVCSKFLKIFLGFLIIASKITA